MRARGVLLLAFALFMHIMPRSNEIYVGGCFFVSRGEVCRCVCGDGEGGGGQVEGLVVTGARVCVWLSCV